MRQLLEDLIERIGRANCRARHNNIGLPQFGKYRCLVCLREYSSREAIPETLEWVSDREVVNG